MTNRTRIAYHEISEKLREYFDESDNHLSEKLDALAALAEEKDKVASQNAVIDQLRTELATRTLENRNLYTEVRKLSWPGGADGDATKRELRKRIIDLERNCAFLGEKCNKALERAVAADADAKEGRNYRSQNVNLQTKIAMLEARLKTFEGAPALCDPKEHVLLDGIEDNGEPISEEQARELFARLKAVHKQLTLADAEIGKQSRRACDAELRLEKLERKEAPFGPDAAGTEWIPRFLRDYGDKAAALTFRPDTKLWEMVSLYDCFVIFSSSDLCGLRKEAEAWMLENMPDPHGSESLAI